MIIGYLFSYGYILCVLSAAVMAGHFRLVGQEGKRKVVHVLLVFTWMILVQYFKGTIHIILIPASFVILNYLSYKLTKKADGTKLPLLSAMEREGEEETFGTVYYAFSVMIMGLITLFSDKMLIPCGIGLFCMAFGDGMAGIFGKKSRGIFAKKLWRDKSLGGSLACAVFSMAGCLLFASFAGCEIELAKIFMIGVSCAVLELAGHGLDNLTVPFGCMIITSLLL